MKRYFIHHALFRLLAPLVYGILVYLLVLLLNNDVKQAAELIASEEVYVCIALSYLSFETVRALIIVFARVAKEVRPQVYIPLQLLVTAMVSVTLVITCLQIYFSQVIGFSMSQTQVLIFTTVYLITALLYNLLYFSNYYLQKENTLKLAAEKQQHEVLEMEMLEFRNDINPDLLYESLESLIALMYRDVERAEEYIDNLASAYRYVLANRQQDLVTVGQDVDAGQTLVRLLNEQYHGQLKLHVSVEPDEAEGMLVPGSLPVVIEAIIRNTIITRFEPFSIRVYVEDNYVTVQTKLNDKLMVHASSEMAVQRLQKSYSLYSDLPLIRVKAYQENYIKLPILRLRDEAVAF